MAVNIKIGDIVHALVGDNLTNYGRAVCEAPFLLDGEDLGLSPNATVTFEAVTCVECIGEPVP